MPPAGGPEGTGLGDVVIAGEGGAVATGGDAWAPVAADGEGDTAGAGLRNAPSATSTPMRIAASVPAVRGVLDFIDAAESQRRGSTTNPNDQRPASTGARDPRAAVRDAAAHHAREVLDRARPLPAAIDLAEEEIHRNRPVRLLEIALSEALTERGDEPSPQVALAELGRWRA